MSRQARALTTLLAEVNAAAPNRSKLSDGGVGDPRHAAGTSDHNANGAGVWRARDFTHDPAGGLDCDRLAAVLEELLKAGKHPALGSGAYVIWRDRILSRDKFAQGWRDYAGDNPHTRHLHLSVATAAAGYDSGAPWGIAGHLSRKDDDVSAQDVWGHRLDEVDRRTPVSSVTAAGLLAQTHKRAGDTARAANDLQVRVRGIEAALVALAAALGPDAAKAVGQAMRAAR